MYNRVRNRIRLARHLRDVKRSDDPETKGRLYHEIGDLATRISQGKLVSIAGKFTLLRLARNSYVNAGNAFEKAASSTPKGIGHAPEKVEELMRKRESAMELARLTKKTQLAAVTRRTLWRRIKQRFARKTKLGRQPEKAGAGLTA